MMTRSRGFTKFDREAEDVRTRYIIITKVLSRITTTEQQESHKATFVVVE